MAVNLTRLLESRASEWKRRNPERPLRFLLIWCDSSIQPAYAMPDDYAVECFSSRAAWNARKKELDKRGGVRGADYQLEK